MKRHRILPYGTWSSLVTSEITAEAGLRLGNLHVDKNTIYLSFMNPKEKGRGSLYRIHLDGKTKELTPDPISVRSSVHEYGGKAFTFYQDIGIFSSYENHQLYLLNNHKTTQITSCDNYRFIDFVIHPSKSYLISVAEEHQDTQVINKLCKIDLKTGTLTTLAEGYDFYASPRISPNGSQLAWMSWNHPFMPWDSTELFVANLTDTGLHDTKLIAGSSDESILEPQWKDDKTLYFISDRSSFWNLYTYSNKVTSTLHSLPFDIGLPHWMFGHKRYTFIHDTHLAFIGTEEGIDTLFLLHIAKNHLEKISLSFTHIVELYLVGDHLIFIAADPSSPQTLYSYHLKDKKLSPLFSSQPLSISKTNISIPLSIKAPTQRLQTTYGFYYPPKQEGFLGTKKEKPPLIIKCHGGPTSHTPMRMMLDTLYFTTRGFGVLDMNYSGSTGYGRAYRKKLHHEWGIIDVQDCIDAARFLVKESLVDQDRMVIKGGSAGGFTALSAVTFHDVFAAAICLYGVTDLSDLAKSTHKFEKHYLDDLIGSFPECSSRYEARSPLFHAERIDKPVLFFHGKKDAVVPLAQAEKMLSLLKGKSPLTELVIFENEGHGFRSSETIKTVLEKELEFYLKLFHLSPS